jgi:AAA15 family ATPase/GTPase
MEFDNMSDEQEIIVPNEPSVHTDDMLTNISISGFRCFDNSTFGGFRRVNLIGGMNNAGKTALLEAIYLGCQPTPDTITSLQAHRRESEAFIKAKPEQAWDNFFFKTPTEQRDKIDIVMKFKKEQHVRFQKDKRDFKILLGSGKNGFLKKIHNIEYDTYAALTIDNNLEKKETISQLMSSINHAKYIAKATCQFIPQAYLLPNRQLAEEYNVLQLNMQGDILLKAFRLIEPTISEIIPDLRGEPILHARRQTGAFMPLTLFGDAMNKLATYTIRLLQASGGILLIDEIENGIHYSNQEKVWQLLFELAIAHNVQIFATTHSLEMIKAFANIAEKYESEAAYFEMARHAKTSEIIAIKLSNNVLAYRLDANEPLRGEL